MKNRKSKYLALLPIFAWTFLCVFPVILYAQETSFDLPEGGHLIIEGENFTFEQVVSTVDGEEIILEHAIWDGRVTAHLSTVDGDILLETGHIEVVFEGENVTSLIAGPEVMFTGLDGRALFECVDVLIDFPTSVAGDETYSGICHDVHGYYLADAYQLGLEGDDQYEVNFTADTVRLGRDEAILESPCLSLGNLDNPDVAISSGDINLRIGTHPDTGERDLLGARLSNLSVSFFGNRLNVLPFPVWRGFVPSHEPGFRTSLPSIGWEGSEGPRIDFAPVYTFNMQSVDVGPRIIFRMDTFPFARSYPEIIADVEKDNLYFETRTGYRREEDSAGDPVPTRAEPEITFGLRRIPVGDTKFGIRASAFWGHLRDMRDGPDLDRWGWRARLDHGGIPVGDFKLSGSLEYSDLNYELGSNYRILDGRVRLRYVDPPHWGASLTYRRVRDWGLTPFLFDKPQVVEELGLREQSRFSRRWGAGFNWAWDFASDEFERQECHLTYILDSFQVSLGWDFANESIKVYFALPGDLK